MLISLLEFLNLIDYSGIPTKEWGELKKDSLPSKVLGRILRTSYKKVFDDLGDEACSQATNYLVEYFMNTGASKKVAYKMAKTFKALCSLSKFDTGEDDATDATKEAKDFLNLNNSSAMKQVTKSSMPVQSSLKSHSCVELHIDFQIHITPDLEDRQIEKIFESIAKYILKNTTKL